MSKSPASKLIYPGDPAFLALYSNLDKYNALHETVEYEKSKPTRSPKRIRLLEAGLKHFLMGACQDEPYFDFATNFWLSDKGGRKVKLKLKPAQKILADHFYTALADRGEYHPHGRPVRTMVPKSRQHGITQIIAALFYRHIRTYPNQLAYVLAQHEGPARQIFRKYQYFHKNDPFRPSTISDSKREMLFGKNGSGIIVDTAGVQETSFAHGFTFQLAHLSELSRYRTANLGSMISDFLQTIPNEMEAFTAIFGESTGHGMDNLFAAWCNEIASFNEAVELSESVMEDFENISGVEWDLIFFPWMDRWDTRIAFRSNKERERFIESMDEEEKRFLKGVPQHAGPPKTAELEQIKWYRRTLNEMRGESGEVLTTDEKRRKMKQQQPSTLAESFTSSGQSAFDLDALDDIQKRATSWNQENFPKGPWRGDLTFDWDDTLAHAEFDTPAVRRSDFTRSKNPIASLTVWEWPQDGHTYVGGWDFSEGAGTDDADYTVCSMRCQQCRKTAFRLRIRGARSEPHSIMGQLRILSKHWNDGLINPETNSAPSLPIWLSKTDRAEYLVVKRRSQDSLSAEGVQEQYGFRTGLNKILLVNEHRRAMAQEPESYNDLECIREMRVFRKERVAASGAWKYPGATGKGQHDDICVADALARMADRENPTYDIGDMEAAMEDESEKAKCFPMLTVDNMMKWQDQGLDFDTNPLSILEMLDD